MSIFTSVLLALAVSSSVVNARVLPRSSNDMFVNDVHYSSVPDGSDTLTFTLDIPEPTANSTTCTGSWPHNEAVGKSLKCGRVYAASISSFTSYNDFSLHLTAWYHDRSVGAPPYDVVTAFANTDVKEPAITCAASSDDDQTVDCTQPSGTTINAPITSMIAKSKKH